MFGTFRFLLAMLVLYSHVIHFTLAGAIAVFGFFTLSGYLMTKVVTETYRDGFGGYCRFLANRALRIYPAYYVAMIFAAAVLLLLGPRSGDGLPAGFANIPGQLILIGLVKWQPAIVGPAWSLGLELLFYLAIGALLGRSRLITTLWLIAAVEWLVGISILHPMPWEWRYTDPFAVSVTFASGAALYHYRDYFRRLGPKNALAAIALFLFYALTAPGPFVKFGIGLYPPVLLAFYAIASLRTMPQTKLDDYLGDLAYPVFLVHIPCHLIAARLTDHPPVAFAWTVALTLVVAAAIIICVERPLKPFRQRLRSPHRPAMVSGAV